MRKNVLRTLALVLVFSTLLTVSAFAQAATITGYSVNFRSGPGTEYDVIGCFDYGTSVDLLDTSNAYWYLVSYNGASGYVYSSYVKVIEDASAGIIIGDTGNQSVTVTAQEGYINSMYVRFRSGPGSEYNILGEYNQGTPVTVKSKTDTGWYEAVINGQTGYVFSTYVTLNGSGSVPAPQPTPDPAPQPTPVPSGSTGYINSDGINFRYGPATWYDVIQTCNTGTPLTYVSTDDAGWAKVIINGQTGYVYGGFVTLSDAQPDPTPTPDPNPVPTPTPVPTGRSGYINANGVNFRYGAGTGYGIIGTYDRGTALSVTGSQNGWTQCVINGTTGYVYSSYVSLNDTQPAPTPTPTPTPDPNPQPEPTGEGGYISGNSVRFRSGPSTAYNILGTYNYGTRLTVTGVSGEWTACIINGQSGYVYSTYVTRDGGTGGTTGGEGTGSTGTTGNGVTGRQIADYALQFVGYPYVWGGTSPSGFDCSGLVKYVYSQFGIELKRVACDQATEGIPVDTSNDLRPGDILCFYSGTNYIGHVGIYIGNNSFVHASTYTTGVIVSTLDGYYINRGYIARRIIY